MSETFQITRNQAEAYEEQFVPALFGQWAPFLVELAGVGPGDRVLDVACGTGVVARAAAQRTGTPAQVVGLDLNPAMVEVAARVSPDLDWRQGDAEALPFPDDRFERVLCQSALFFFPHPDQALREMLRVLAPGGTLALQTYASLRDQPGYRRFVETVVRHSGEAAQAPLSTYWSWDLARTSGAVRSLGAEVVAGHSRLGVAHFGSVEALVAVEIDGTPLASIVTPDQRSTIVAELHDVLRPFTTADRLLELPIRADLVAATTPATPDSTASPASGT